MTKQTGRQPSIKQTKLERRREEQRQRAVEQARAARNKHLTMIISIVVAVVLIGGIGTLVYFASRHPGQASASSVNAPGFQSLNGISCDSSEQLSYHIHAHVSLYINGQQVPVPQNIGIASDGSCFYWLHTHDTTGVIHIESPQQKTYTLGSFFDLWEFRFPELQFPQELSNPKDSGWQVYVDGKPYTGNFRDIPLDAHALITLAFQSPGVTPDTTYNWNGL